MIQFKNKFSVRGDIVTSSNKLTKIALASIIAINTFSIMNIL
ncbi:hypothetical protein Phpb_03527 [Photorhabdus namnaonensis]|uniref:Uncharacterized protein n=1 Tax=Photorhabdus namnaonensis TaxID=1851568 RepID=A0A1B8YE92_9GAMM|nr:hypothetical protein Phpb_03527 [Photorhabdus namnaonensis]